MQSAQLFFPLVLNQCQHFKALKNPKFSLDFIQTAAYVLALSRRAQKPAVSVTLLRASMLCLISQNLLKT
jgi:hypothetical protein